MIQINPSIFESQSISISYSMIMLQMSMILMLYDTDIDCIIQREYHRFNSNGSTDIDGFIATLLIL